MEKETIKLESINNMDIEKFPQEDRRKVFGIMAIVTLCVMAFKAIIDMAKD